MQHIDQVGGPTSYNHYAVGWAHAMDTPYQWTKRVASHWGGARNGTIVHWPKRINGRGEHRWQFHHVIDVAPTILEAAGIPEPVMVNDTSKDWTQAEDLSKKMPDKLHELQRLWLIEARSTTCCLWTTVWASASIRILQAGRC